MEKHLINSPVLETCDVELFCVLNNFRAIVMVVYIEDRLDEITYVCVKV